jgi:hypothetical protein
MKNILVSKNFASGLAITAAASLFAAAAQAGVLTYEVTADTSALVGTPPFNIDFQVNDGDAVAGNTSAVVSDFSFGGGSAGAPGTIYTFNDASGDLSSSVSLSDLGFGSEFAQDFTAGSTFSFTVTLTSTTTSANQSRDGFIFSIYDVDLNNTASNGTSLFKLEVIGDGFNGLIGTPTGDPTVTFAAVPEPGAASLLLISVGGLAMVRRFRRKPGFAA